MDPTWKPPLPCAIGDKLSDIDTPALILDWSKMKNNLQAMPSFMQQFPNVAVRPHGKAHKCPSLAKLQVEHGAVGMCCQTLVEAEAMVYNGGISDILVSNELIGKRKLRRFAALSKHCQLSICVDDVNNLKDISEVAMEMQVTIACVVEVNVGQNRCGVEPGEPAAVLADEIRKLPNVVFKGIQCYQGWNQHVRKAEDREVAVGKVVEFVKQTLQALEARGIKCDYVTGGGTGTFPYEAGSGVFTEVQPGSYVVMDVDYGLNFDVNGKPFRDFEHSLFVLATVQSVTPGKRAVVDAGMKALSLDSGVPVVHCHPELTFANGGDEHGILTPAGDLKVGDQVWLIPGHCDPTVNLYDWLVGVEDGKVKAVWSVLGRGPGV